LKKIAYSLAQTDTWSVSQDIQQSPFYLYCLAYCSRTTSHLHAGLPLLLKYF